MSREISNQDNLIDSRDVIARIEELTEERDAWVEEKREAEGLPEEEDEELRIEWDHENPELAALLALAEEAEGYSSDWNRGATLIRESYFGDYAREFAEDIGAVDNTAGWPCTCIDWEKAARELAMDYTLVNFDGVDYYVS